MVVVWSILLMVRALIFDVDGTLAQTERDGHRVAFNLAFEGLGLDWHWDIDFYGQLLEIGGGKERLRHYIFTYCSDLLLYPHRYRHSLELVNVSVSNFQGSEFDRFIVSVHRLKSQFYAQILKENQIPLRIGVKRLILEAREKGVRGAIASTASVENVKALLDSSFSQDMASWFEVIVAGDMVKKKKPAPDIYLLALEKLQLSPEECIVIEDTNQGLVAATNANLKTVVTVNDYSKNQDFELASLVLDHLGEKKSPFQVIKGNSLGYSYFNLEMAEKLPIRI